MIKIINGTFETGNGLTLWDVETNRMFHKIVDNNGFIEIDGILYKSTDFINGVYNSNDIGSCYKYCPHIDNCTECPRYVECQKEENNYKMDISC